MKPTTHFTGEPSEYIDLIGAARDGRDGPFVQNVCLSSSLGYIGDNMVN